jgi:hypothetical protein
MPQGTCTIEGCGSNHRLRRGLCNKHYLRLTKNGDPLRLARRERFEQQPTVCAVDGCAKPRKSRGWCSAHYLRWLRRGGDVAVKVYRPRAAEVRYGAVHARLRRDRGLARRHLCLICGWLALQWAYDYQDPAERTDVVNGYEVPYSLDPGHYIPLCASCHKLFDRAHAAERKGCEL